MQVMHCPYSINGMEGTDNSCVVKMSWEALHQDKCSISQN